MITIPTQSDRPLIGLRATVNSDPANVERGIAGVLGTVLDYQLDLGPRFPVVVIVLLTDTGVVVTVLEDDITLDVTGDPSSP